MRKMGIDYGSKRVGIAFSDEGGNMAFPHGVLQNNAQLLAQLLQLIEEKQVGEIVIGHSLDKEGKPNAIQERINELVTDLTLEAGLPIHLESEIFSTQEAIRFQGRTAHTDASAAAVILNSFITRKR